jgi:hypothetical protein
MCRPLQTAPSILSSSIISFRQVCSPRHLRTYTFFLIAPVLRKSRPACTKYHDSDLYGSRYEHILAYLRSAPSTPDSPATLPRAVQLISSPSARLQALLELRDEASYLDLDELHKLCNDEIQRRESAFSHTRIGSTSSASLRSVHSVHTFREQSTAGSESSQQSHRDRPRDRDHARDRDTIVTHRSAPKERDSVAMYDDQEAPPSLKISTSRTHMRSRSHGRNLDSIQAPLRSPPPLRATPPPGWI